MRVVEVNRADRSARRRERKSDPLDAKTPSRRYRDSGGRPASSPPTRTGHHLRPSRISDRKIRVTPNSLNASRATSSRQPV